MILAFASALLSGAIALTVAWQERRSVTHWAFVAGMAILTADSLFTGFSADALMEDIVYWQNWRLIAMSFLPGLWLFFSLSFARGNYREFLHKWRLALLAAFALPIVLGIASYGRMIVSIDQTETGHQWILKLSSPGYLLNLVFLVSSVLVLMNLERTYRASVGTMRWRIKFVIMGLGVLFAARAYTSSQALLFHAVSLSLQTVNTAALLAASLLIARSLVRSGHFEVKVYPSHSVLQNSLTVMVAGVYLLIVGVLAKLVAYYGGDTSFALKTFLVLISLVLLTVLLLSEKVRLYSGRLISRHFQRPQYDYRTIWRTFAEATARRVEQKDLCGAVVKLVSEVFQALSVTIWLIDERKAKLTFGASTTLFEAQATSLAMETPDTAAMLSALEANSNPVDLDTSKELWAVTLRRLHPDEFRKGGNRVCIPLAAGREVLGVMTLGDRVGGLPYSHQDMDLLKAVSDQAAASLLNLRLTQHLSQAKQLEAFQAMSTFFVHDLKNTASTLSLMLQNLPVHFHDPNFREDALRGISKTVTHINTLISRLGLLRRELEIRAVEADLNELVTGAVEDLAQTSAIELSKELQPLPKVRLDPSQIQNVVTNLLLNARDAVSSGGKISVGTSRQNGWVVLAVADTGCGMSPEFVERSLFRPFQTTKKTGIGIGMFQCKMIMEAHRGRIEVESEPGKGTAFRLLFPIGPTNQ